LHVSGISILKSSFAPAVVAGGGDHVLNGTSGRRITYLIPAAARESCTQLLQQQQQQEGFFFFTDSCQCALIKTDQITLFDNIYNRDSIITISRESITKVCSQISAAKRDSCKQRRRWRS
jgi:hypothetical protein